MDKHPSLPKSPSISLEEAWIEHPAVQWAIANGKQIAYWALIAVLLLFTAYRYLASAAVQNEQEFISAESAMQTLASGSDTDASLQKLQAILKKHPELHAKYDGQIAQALLTAQNPSEAAPFAERTLKRTQGETPAPYLDYSATTLLIADGKYPEALKAAQALKAHTEYPTLYAFNLLRIALLNRELKQPQEEKAAWAEVKQLAEGTHPVKISPVEMRKILSHYNTQGIPIESFIR